MIRESHLQKSCMRAAKDLGGLFLKWSCPGTRGVPDGILLMPGCPVVFIELKRPEKSTIAKTQVYWRELLCSMGFEVWSPVNSVDDFRAGIELLLAAKKRKQIALDDALAGVKSAFEK